MKNHNAYFKFYPDAWLGDEKLALCRFSTKGAWIDLICHMHKCDPYGYLIVNDISLQPKDIQKMLHIDNDKHFEIIWGELLKYGIIKFDNKIGAYYSKKLLTEYEKDANSYDEWLEDIPKAMRILKYFNNIVGKDYWSDPQSRYMQNVVHSWFDKYEDEKIYYRVIEYVFDKWKNDSNMYDFIKPTIFFGKHFPKYVAESINFKLKGDKKKKKVDFGDSAGFDEFNLFERKRNKK